MINSLLDNDLYSFTQQQAVLECFPEAKVTYQFTNRNLDMTFNTECVERIQEEVLKLKKLELSDTELKYMQSLGFFKPGYLMYLKSYRFDPSEVYITLLDGHLSIIISGHWHSTILWEVVLMQIISECYFRIIDTNWNFNTPICQVKQINEKCRKLAEAGCSFVEGGSRRRRSYYTQEAIVGECKHYTNFIGTSNVHFARLMNVKAIGTMAHQWIMGVSVLQGLRHANQLALREWLKVYNADLGIALSDTYGSDAFYEDFDKQLTKTFDGVRHDSGDPIEFAKKTISHYAKLKIDPRSKTIVFSDGLDADTAIKINEWCKGKIKCSFLIGTNFTNDFLNHDGVKSKPLNMVIKLRTCDGVDVVKLSDVPGKATGDEDAVRVAKWTFFNTPLDS